MDQESQCIAVVPPGASFELPAGGFVHLERLSVLDDLPDLAGQRVTVMAHVSSPTSDARTVQMDTAISSFVIGRDYDQSADLIFSPVDRCTLDTVGPGVRLQLLYSLTPAH
jgi:hypothetical protein